MNDDTWIEISGPGQLPEPFVPVFTYWDRKRAGAWAPKLGEFRLDDLPTPLIPWSVIVDIPGTPKDLVFRFWGSRRTALIGQELTGKALSDIADEYMRVSNLDEYEAACRLKAPLLCDTPITNVSGVRGVMQSLRLPLSDGGDEVRHVYSALNHERITELHYEYYGTGK